MTIDARIPYAAEPQPNRKRVSPSPASPNRHVILNHTRTMHASYRIRLYQRRPARGSHEPRDSETYNTFSNAGFNKTFMWKRGHSTSPSYSLAFREGGGLIRGRGGWRCGVAKRSRRRGGRDRGSGRKASNSVGVCQRTTCGRSRRSSWNRRASSNTVQWRDVCPRFSTM